MSSTPDEAPDIRLDEYTPPWFRLGAACIVTFALTWEVTGYFREGRASGSTAALLATVAISLAVICMVLFRRNVCWIIRDGEIQIHRDSIAGDRQTSFVRSGEITRIKLVRDLSEEGDHFYIRIWLATGDDIQSPPLRDSKHADEVTDQIKRRLKVPQDYVPTR